VHHALSPSSAKNDRLPASTPSTLVRRERLGMLAGPALYFLSRWDTRLDDRPEPGPETVGIPEPSAPAVDIDLVAIEIREARVAQ
jgi:hypothetical protein